MCLVITFTQKIKFEEFNNILAPIYLKCILSLEESNLSEKLNNLMGWFFYLVFMILGIYGSFLSEFLRKVLFFFLLFRIFFNSKMKQNLKANVYCVLFPFVFVLLNTDLSKLCSVFGSLCFHQSLCWYEWFEAGRGSTYSCSGNA